MGARRGETLWTSHDAKRPSPWGVHWNEYQTGHVGRPKTRARFFKTEAEQLEFKQRTEAGLAAPVPVAPAPSLRRADSLAVLAGNHPDREQLTGWLAQVRDQRDAATLKNYRDCIKHYIAPEKGHKRYPGLGNLVVSTATCKPKVFADFMLELHKSDVSLSMRKRIKATLSALCTYAKFAGRLDGDNPCFSLGRILRQKGEIAYTAKPNPFTGDEVARIFDQLRACEDPWAVAYYQFLLDVGVRPGEAAALKWSAVDLENRTAQIELAYSEATAKDDPASRGDKLPKTHEPRDVDLTDEVCTLLLQWRADQKREALRRGRPVPAYVFTTRRLARCLPNGTTLRAVFARTMAACAIVGHTPYNFRDTFATSHLIGNWERKLSWVSHQLGHKTTATTTTFYYGYVKQFASRGFANEIRHYVAK